MIPLRRQTDPTSDPRHLTSAATVAPAGPVAARVAGLVACLALVLVWVAPAAHGDDGARPTDSASLREVVEERRADVAEAEDALSVAALAASDALERYTLAVRRLDAAHAEEAARQAELTAAQDRLAAARASLGRWARSAYAGGGALSPGAGLATVLRSRTTDDLGSAVVTLRRVGESRSRAIDTVEAAELEQVRAAAAAAAAAHTAETAAVEASRFRTQADTALQRQREVLSTSETQLAEAQDAATSAAQREQAIAAANALAAGGAAGNRVSGPVGDCRGGDVEHFPNGMIPLSALCRLAAQPNHYLRADAALAFDTMSRAFAARFGTPVCVTDSYRTYAEQVRLKAAKPTLAATPGTSNHGWGTATDLCGGIQSFGTAEHRWLAANAPLYNWFHPSWARQDGGKPEPWHFEFAG